MADLPQIPVEELTWNEYKMLVISKLNEYGAVINKIHEDLGSVKDDMADLKNELDKHKIKSGMLGLLAGSIPSIISAFGIKLKIGGGA